MEKTAWSLLLRSCIEKWLCRGGHSCLKEEDTEPKESPLKVKTLVIYLYWRQLKPLALGALCVHAQLCPTLCNPMDCNQPGSSVHGIFQTRILEWVAVSSFRLSSPPRDLTYVPCISWIDRQVLYHWTTWEAIYIFGFGIFQTEGSPRFSLSPPTAAVTWGWARNFSHLLARLSFMCIPNSGFPKVNVKVWRPKRPWRQTDAFLKMVALCSHTEFF